MTYLKASNTLNPEIMTMFQALCFNSPKNAPEPPKELIEFRALNNQTKYSIQDKFYKQIEIQEYLDEKWKTELYNRDCLLELINYKKLHMKPEEKQTIDAKIDEFVKILGTQENVFRALKIDLSKFEIEDQNKINPKDWQE